MTPEGALQNCILDWLAAERILAFRMNTGAVKTEKRFFRFGVPGMADILAFPLNKRVVWANYDHSKECEVAWIEVKSERGQQSALQKSFQQQVEEAGHRYVLARSLEDVQNALQ